MKPLDYAREWVHDLKPYSPGRTIEGMIKLASNENDYGPSPKVVAGLRKRVPEVYRYPYKDEGVKRALAKYCRVKPGNIVMGDGSDEIIELVIKAFRGPIGSHYPTFLEYPTYARMHNVPYISSRLNPDFTFDVGRFIKETGDANIIFLCTPNNPTGSIIEPRDVVEVARTGKIVVVDEAYSEYWGVSLVPHVRDYPNLIVLKTMAKAFGLAGMRFGYAVAEEEVAETLNKVKAPFNVNYLAHEAAMLALKDLPYMRRTVKKIVADRDKLEKALRGKYRVVPSHANFILADVSPLTSDEFFGRMLGRKIVVRPQPQFEGFPGNWVRITVGTSEENKKLIKALKLI